MGYQRRRPETMEHLEPAEVVKRAKKKALALLERQDRTESQLLSKLAEKGFPEYACEEALAYVKSFHYVDDERFARNYIRYRQDSKSRQQLKLDLIRKGVKKETIDLAMEEEYENEEKDMILALLHKKRFDPATADVKEKNRIMGFLLRIGYSLAEVKECMRQMEHER